jgi:hypothetical protein
MLFLESSQGMSFITTKLKYQLFFIYLIMRTLPLEAQVLNDTVSLNLVKTTVGQIYNMRFSDAAETTNLLSRTYPDHPVVFLLRGMIIYWEGYPLLSGSEKSMEFEKQIRQCIARSEEYEPEYEAEFLLPICVQEEACWLFIQGMSSRQRLFPLAEQPTGI